MSDSTVYSKKILKSDKLTKKDRAITDLKTVKIWTQRLNS